MTEFPASSGGSFPAGAPVYPDGVNFRVFAPGDSASCLLPGQNTVPAGLAGKTDMVGRHWHRQGTHVPIPLAVAQRKKLDPGDWLGTGFWPSPGSPVTSLERRGGCVP